MSWDLKSRHCNIIVMSWISHNDTVTSRHVTIHDVTSRVRHAMLDKITAVHCEISRERERETQQCSKSIACMHAMHRGKLSKREERYSIEFFSSFSQFPPPFLTCVPKFSSYFLTLTHNLSLLISFPHSSSYFLTFPHLSSFPHFPSQILTSHHLSSLGPSCIITNCCWGYKCIVVA